MTTTTIGFYVKHKVDILICLLLFHFDKLKIWAEQFTYVKKFVYINTV